MLPDSMIDEGYTFEPLMTLYLTDLTLPEEIQRAYESGVVKAVKLYPAGATTNSDSGVTDLRYCSAALDCRFRSVSTAKSLGSVSMSLIESGFLLIRYLPPCGETTRA